MTWSQPSTHLLGRKELGLPVIGDLIGDPPRRRGLDLKGQALDLLLHLRLIEAPANQPLHPEDGVLIVGAGLLCT